ncbi:hypothetical protein BY457_1374 [Marinilabilia salmonicolor]|nr:hypothetical protein BY457_1374 [Marinilabilia salmonicolor]
MLGLTVDGMVSCGITKRFPISLHRLFLRATNLRKPLKPACTIPCVRHWRFLFSSCPSIKFALSLSSVLERDGRKGSLAKFGCRVGFVRFANVPCSEGMVKYLFLFLIIFPFEIIFRNTQICSNFSKIYRLLN